MLDPANSRGQYEKGFTFLYHLEKLIGKTKWDKFIPHYFTVFKTKSLDSYEFKATLLSFFESDAEASQKLNDVDWDTWFYQPGFPPKPDFDTSLADQCLDLANRWEALNQGSDGFKPNAKDIESFSANQSIVFLEKVQTFEKPLSPSLVDLMGKVYRYSTSKNIEVVTRYLVVGLQAKDKSVYGPAAELLGRVGRMKFVRPLFRNLLQCDFELAKKAFHDNKDFYHPICRGMMEKMLHSHEHGKST